MNLPGSLSARSAVLAFLLLAAAIAPPRPALSAEGDPVSIGVRRVIRSEVLGEERELLVATPEGYESASLAYPVLYLLYGDQVRGYFAEAVHAVHRLSAEGSVPPMIVVGVVNVDRYRDLSPAGRRGNPSGIEPFTRCFVEELIPFVESEYRTKEFRVLVGPQAGAEFGLYTLAKRPGLFDGFLLQNPFRSPEVHDRLAEATKEVVREGLPSFTRLRITAYDRAGFVDMTEAVESLERFEREVAAARPENLDLAVRYVENVEDFIPSPGVKEGLRWMFREYRIPEGLEAKGLSDITEHYAGLSARYGYEVDVPEMTLASAADGLLREGMKAEAEEVLDYLIRLHPASLDGHWRLANLHREAGERDSAILHYRKCLELMPGMAPARHWLNELGEEG